MTDPNLSDIITSLREIIGPYTTEVIEATLDAANITDTAERDEVTDLVLKRIGAKTPA